MTRLVAHLLGWHTPECLADPRCRRLQGTKTVETAPNGRWWRYVTPCCQDGCTEKHS